MMGLKKLIGGMAAACGLFWLLAAQPAAAQSVTRSCSAAPAGQGTGTICTATMSSGDGTHTRTFKYYFPAALGTNKPLVFVFHGGTQNADDAMSESDYGWNKKADANKFTVVFPEGKSSPSNANERNWNDCRAAWATPGDGGMDPADDSFSDWNDVTYVNNLLNWFQNGAALQPDMSRVFANGPSNGGLMTQRLARESIASRFRAFGPSLAQLPAKDECPANPATSRASGQTNVMLFTYGSEDQLMPPAGGCVAAPFVTANCEKGRVKSRDASLNYFKTWLGISTSASGSSTNIASTNASDGDFGNNNLTCSENSTQTQTDFVNGSNVLRLRLVLVNGAGHTQPGTVQSTYIAKNTYKVGCRNLDRKAIDYLTQFWGI